jgi:hypothetical protein
MEHLKQTKITSFAEMKKSLPARISRSKWINVGGQLIQDEDVEKIKQQVKTGKIQSWDQLHATYRKFGDEYSRDKLLHAYTSLLEILNITSKQFTPDVFKKVLQDAVVVKEWMSKGIYDSREKDYTNPFRKMVYDNKKEMDKVIGKIEENSFIQDQFKDLDAFKKKTKDIIKKLQP